MTIMRGPGIIMLHGKQIATGTYEIGMVADPVDGQMHSHSVFIADEGHAIETTMPIEGAELLLLSRNPNRNRRAPITIAAGGVANRFEITLGEWL